MKCAISLGLRRLQQGENTASIDESRKQCPNEAILKISHFATMHLRSAKFCNLGGDLVLDFAP